MYGNFVLYLVTITIFCASYLFMWTLTIHVITVIDTIVSVFNIFWAFVGIGTCWTDKLKADSLSDEKNQYEKNNYEYFYILAE